MLPGANKGDTKLVYGDRSDEHGGVETPEEVFIRRRELVSREDEADDLTPDEDRMRKQLLAAGLPSKKADIVVARICRGLSFREIALEFGYSAKSAAVTAYYDAIKGLKKRVGTDEED